MKKYIEAQTELNAVAIDTNTFEKELHCFSNSDIRWAKNRKKSVSQRKVKRGEVYQFEFGKNFFPEMSYEHRGMIIGVRNKLLYVLPIFSYDPTKYADVYHPVENPTSKSDYYLLKSSEFSFIQHDSILKLSDIRTVSVNRILYSQSGKIAVNSDTYQQIEKLVLAKVFPTFLHEFEQKEKTIAALNLRIEELSNQLAEAKSR